MIFKYVREVYIERKRQKVFSEPTMFVQVYIKTKTTHYPKEKVVKFF